MTKQFSNYSDLLTFTRASKGHALRPVSYGDELVDNGDFATDSDWTGVNSTLTVVDGQLNVTDAGGYASARQAITTKIGSVYKIEIEIINGANINLDVYNGEDFTATPPDIIIASGLGVNSYVYSFVAEATTSTISLRGNSGNGTVYKFDNVSVKEVTFDESDGTLTLFEHPENVPRVEYDADGNRLGLLVEEARTNFLTYSEDFSNAGWIKLPSDALSSETVTGPFEGTSAYRFTSVDHNHYLEDRNVTVVAGTTYTFSFWGKDAGGAGTPKYRIRDISNGANIARADWPDPSSTEFKRQAITFTAPSGCTNVTISIAYYSGVQVDFYVFGAQLEAGSFPTSYMKNEGDADGKDRSADVASIPVADFGYNQSAGTFFIDITDVISNNNKDYFSVSSSGSFNPESFGLYGTPDTGSTLGYRRRNSAYDPAITSTADIQSTGSKVALSHDASSLVISVDGVATETSSSNSVDTITEIAFGGSGHGVTGDVHSKHIKSIKYYPRRLTNAQLVELTS